MDLLSQIQGGIQLKKVEITDTPPPPSESEGQSLVNALRSAMDNRRVKIEEEDSDDSDDDDDWSD